MRRRLLSADRAAGLESGLFKDLRDMRDTGEISQEEYDRTHSVLVARMTGKELEPLAAMPGPDGTIAAPGFDLTGEALPERTTNNSGEEPAGPSADSG